MAYTTIDKVQGFFGTTFTANTTPTLTQVNSYIADVDTEINNLTGTVFGTPASNTEIVDIAGESDLFVTEKYPIVAVSSVEKNTSSDVFASDSWAAVPFINDRFRIRTKHLYSGLRRLRFVYTYGFETIPPEVSHLSTLLVVNKIITGQATGDSSTKSISVGPISLVNTVGTERVLNLKNEIAEYKRRVGRYKNVTR